jgi:hypothetical protein
MAARGIDFEPPYGCTWCGDEQHHHGSQWAPIIGLHQWIEPSLDMIWERMMRRRADRLAAKPAKYHATTAWAADGTGESGDPYCADCKTDGCRLWLRVQARLDKQRWGIPVKTRASARGWGGGEPW